MKTYKFGWWEEKICGDCVNYKKCEHEYCVRKSDRACIAISNFDWYVKREG